MNINYITLAVLLVGAFINIQALRKGFELKKMAHGRVNQADLEKDARYHIRISLLILIFIMLQSTVTILMINNSH